MLRRRRPDVRRGTAPPGFTLIELLVVIAIITLLISILLPSLSDAREQAKRVKCEVNLGSIGQAVHACFNDNSGHSPTWDDGGAVGAGRDLVMLTWIDVLFDTGYLGFVEAGVCPSDNRPDDLPRARGTSWGFTFVDKFGVDQALRPGVRGSYALNALMNYNNAGDKFEDGARQIFALDGWWSWCGDYNAAWLMRSVVFGQTVDPLWPHWEATMVGWRHPRENIANALFLDGHVSPLRPRRPRSLPEIYSRTTDTARAFTWLPGEHPLRYDWEPYQRDPESGRPASYPGEIEDYFTRVPARVSGNTKAIRWGSGDGGVDWMPEDFPEELSCNWRTAFHRWRYFPSDPADRR